MAGLNRYVIDGIVGDARGGSTVLVCCAFRAEEVSTFEEVSAAEGVESVRRRNGEQEVRFVGGGRVLFRRPGASLRGIPADVVVALGIEHMRPAARDEVFMAARVADELVRV